MHATHSQGYTDKIQILLTFMQTDTQEMLFKNPLAEEQEEKQKSM